MSDVTQFKELVEDNEKIECAFCLFNNHCVENCDFEPNDEYKKIIKMLEKFDKIKELIKNE